MERLHEIMKLRIAASYAILERIHPASVRAVCYRLLPLGLIADMSDKETKKVSEMLTTARDCGLIPFSWIVDEGR
jgi:hypothetical protein